MKIIDHHQLFGEYCKLTGKFGMLIEMGYEDLDELHKAAPYLKLPCTDPNFHSASQCTVYDFGFLLFDTKEEMERHFDLTVGPDGPTSLNPYSGPARVYALTFGPDGRDLNENT